MYQDYMNSEDCVPAKGYNGLVLCDLADGAYDSALGNISAGLENAAERISRIFCTMRSRFTSSSWILPLP